MHLDRYLPTRSRASRNHDLRPDSVRTRCELLPTDPLQAAPTPRRLVPPLGCKHFASKGTALLADGRLTTRIQRSHPPESNRRPTDYETRQTVFCRVLLGLTECCRGPLCNEFLAVVVALCVAEFGPVRLSWHTRGTQSRHGGRHPRARPAGQDGGGQGVRHRRVRRDGAGRGDHPARGRAHHRVPRLEPRWPQTRHPGYALSQRARPVVRRAAAD